MATDSPDWQEVVTLTSGGAVPDAPDWQRTVTGPSAAPIGGGKPTFVTSWITSNIATSGWYTVTSVSLPAGTWLVHGVVAAVQGSASQIQQAAILAPFSGAPASGNIGEIYATGVVTTYGSTEVTYVQIVVVALIVLTATTSTIWLTYAGTATILATYPIGVGNLPNMSGIVAVGWT